MVDLTNRRPDTAERDKKRKKKWGKGEKGLASVVVLGILSHCASRTLVFSRPGCGIVRCAAPLSHTAALLADAGSV